MNPLTEKILQYVPKDIIRSMENPFPDLYGYEGISLELEKMEPSLAQAQWALQDAKYIINSEEEDDDEDETITIPLKVVKRLMSKEIHSHYESACQSLHNGVQRGFLHLANREIQNRIEQACEFSDLEEILSDMDYKMSLQDWVNSL
jgi:hypothetical protein